MVSKFIGSGFGGKLFPWPHSALAATAAQRLNRPVKLMVSRKMMFSNVGHRPRTQQAHAAVGNEGREACLAGAALSQPHLDAGQHPRELRRGDAVSLQRAEPGM